MDHLSRIVRSAHKQHERRGTPGHSEGPPGSMPAARPWVWRRLDLEEREPSSLDSPHGEAYDGPAYEHEDVGVWAQHSGINEFGEQTITVSCRPRNGDYLIEPTGRPQSLEDALRGERREAWEVEFSEPRVGPTGKLLYSVATVTSDRSHESEL